MDETTYDVVVAGGGSAGLSAALALGRSLRRVLVADTGAPRNAPSAQAHNYLGHEGIGPTDLLRLGRAEVEAYGVQIVDTEIVDVRPDPVEEIGFAVHLADGRTVTTRRVLAATGAVDELPEVAGLAERWGRDVLHCPYCHGWEVRGRRIAILATSPMATHQALLFRQLTEHLTVVVAPDVDLPASETERLGARGVRFVDGTPTRVRLEQDRIVGLELSAGDPVACDALVVGPLTRARAEHLRSLGIGPRPVEAHGTLVGTAIPADPMTGQTDVRGVYAAGNATDLTATLIASAAHGLRVGAVINADLAGEDADRAARSQRARLFEAPSWEERYSGDRMWTGRPNIQLVAETSDLPPGRALDIGCGEGGDAAWLASRGWRVTAADFATAALRHTDAAAAASDVADRVETRLLDLRDFDPAGETWDLVSAQFVHLPDGGMVAATRRMAGAVAPGGTLLVVGHHPADHHTGLRHGHESFMFTPEDLAPALATDDWVIDVCETRPRTARHPDTGADVTIRDSVLRAHRLAPVSPGGEGQVPPADRATPSSAIR